MRCSYAPPLGETGSTEADPGGGELRREVGTSLDGEADTGGLVAHEFDVVRGSELVDGGDADDGVVGGGHGVLGHAGDFGGAVEPDDGHPEPGSVRGVG